MTTHNTPQTVVVDGSRYVLDVPADELVNLHVLVPHWLRHKFRTLAHSQGRTMQEVTRESLTEWIAINA